MNKSPQPTLTKTCNSCGLQKPLSAFLQLSGSGGSIYGNTCSTCRKINKDKPSKSIDEGSSTSQTGNKIDAKNKIESDLKKKEFVELTKELHQDEREEKKILTEKRIAKKQDIAAKEKKHRESKKGSFFLDNKDKTSTATIDKQFFAGETAKKTVDYTKPVLDTQIAGKTKHHSSVFLTLQTWLKGNKGNHFINNVEKMGLAGKNGQQPSAKPSEKEKVEVKLSGKMEKIWSSKQPDIKPSEKKENPLNPSSPSRKR